MKLVNKTSYVNIVHHLVSMVELLQYSCTFKKGDDLNAKNEDDSTLILLAALNGY